MKRLVAITFMIWIVGAMATASQPSFVPPTMHPPSKKQKTRPRKATPPVAPQPRAAPAAVVSYQNGLLTIAAENAKLCDIMDRVRDSTGAMVDAPPLNERVTVHLGPQPPARVIAALLDGSHVNYVIVGATDSSAIRAIQVMPESSPGPQPASPQSAVNVEAAAAAAIAQALLIGQTGGDEGVWDNVEVGTPITPPPSASVPAGSPQEQTSPSPAPIVPPEQE
jgi:hypothetical protein